MESSRVLGWSSLVPALVAALALGGCPPPSASCPAGFMLSSEGRCVAIGDSGVSPMGDVGGPVGDASMTRDSGRDAGPPDTNLDCVLGQSQPCGMSSMGPCRMGTRSCTAGGVWGMCMGNVDPVPEVCNAIDDDCDGVVDEAAGLQCIQGLPTSCVTVCGSMGRGACTASCLLPTGDQCGPPIEACNGTDDDCDGVADEDVGVVGPAACLGSCTIAAQRQVGRSIVGLAGGNYGVVFLTRARDQFYFQQVASDGSPVGAVVPLGTDAVPIATDTFSAAFDGTNVVVAYTHNMGSDTSAYAIGYAVATGGRAWGPFTLPVPSLGGTRRGDYVVHIADATMGRATFYFRQVDTLNTTTVARRYRVNTAGSVPTIIQQSDAVTDMGSTMGVAWAAIATAGGDVIVYRNTSGNITMALGPTGDTTVGTFTSLGTVQTFAQQPNVTAIALAIRSASSPVSATNPIGLAWQRPFGSGTFITQLPDLNSPPRPAPVMPLTGSVGTPVYPNDAPSWLRLFAVQDASTYMNTGFFYVVSLDGDYFDSATYHGRLAVWEAVTGGRMPHQRQLTVPGVMTFSHWDIAVAASGSGIRIAEQNNTGDVATRQLGCF